ncbi:MAG TPA: protein kinase, partial [Gemmatimonadaceae bacterium]|nr:protein kinase [Gemmatimonadaceae bacterium]
PHSGTTSAGMAIGTPAYMAPEQLAADPNANHRVDLYAVGLLAYELLTGEQPFAEPSPAETMAALLTRMPAPISELRDDVPAPLTALITRLLAKHPNDRPQSAAETLDELDQVITPQAGGITSTVGQPATRRLLDTPIPHEAAPAPAQRRSRLLLPLGLTGIVAAAALAALLLRDRSATPARDPIPTLTPGDTARAPSLTSGAKGQPTLLTDTTSKIAAQTKIEVPKRDSVRPPVTRPRDTTAVKTATSPRPVPVAQPKAGPPPRAGTALLTPTGKPKRIAILPARDATQGQQYAAFARTLEDSLRRAAIILGYNIATDAELVRLLAQNDGTLQRRLAEEIGIGALIVPYVIVRERELQAQVNITDVWRGQGLSERGRSDPDDPNGSLVVIRDVMRSLNRISWRQRSDARRTIVFDVENPTNNDTLTAFARTLTDSLRALTMRQMGAGGQIVGDSAARATRDAAERRFLALQIGAGAYVAGTLSRRGADSLRVRLSVRDVTEDRSYDTEYVIPFRDPLPALPDVLARVAADFGRVNWGPRGLAPTPPR